MDKIDMSNTPELERLYYALGDFIYKALSQYQVDKTKMVGLETINAVRDCTLNFINQALEAIGQKIREEEQKMNKYEIFAVQHFLNRYPAELSFTDLMQELRNDNPEVRATELNEAVPLEDLAGLIEDMVSRLKRVFDEND